MAVKINLFYNQAAAGWSETYYASTNDPYTLVNSLTDRQLQAFVWFRSSLTQFYAVRASVVGSPRVSYSRLLPSKFYGSNALSVGTDTPDVVSTDAVCKLTGVARQVRRVFIRGLPDDAIKRDAYGAFVPSSSLTKGLDSMLSQIAGLGWQIQYYQKPAGGGITKYGLLLISPSTDHGNWTTLKLNNAAQPFVEGDNVVFQKVPTKYLPRFPRQAVVKATGVSGSFATISIAYPMLTTSFAPANMQVFKRTLLYDPIAQLDFERFSEHKTGRPIGLLRGRSPAVQLSR